MGEKGKEGGGGVKAGEQMDRERARVYVGERGLKERARGVCVCGIYM